MSVCVVKVCKDLTVFDIGQLASHCNSSIHLATERRNTLCCHGNLSVVLVTESPMTSQASGRGARGEMAGRGEIKWTDKERGEEREKMDRKEREREREGGERGEKKSKWKKRRRWRN